MVFLSSLEYKWVVAYCKDNLTEFCKGGWRGEGTIDGLASNPPIQGGGVTVSNSRSYPTLQKRNDESSAWLPEFGMDFLQYLSALLLQSVRSCY